MNQLSDWVIVYDNVIPSDLCDKLMKLVDETPSGRFNEEWRRCTEFCKIDSTPLWGDFKAVVKNVFEMYKKDTDCSNLNHIRMIEAPSVFKYDAIADKPHFFNYHADNWNMATASRQLSLVAYLNDVEEGGETSFPELDIKVKPKRGRIVVFPPFYSYRHMGEVPKSNDKYIAVSWLHYGGVGHIYRVHNL